MDTAPTVAAETQAPTAVESFDVLPHSLVVLDAPIRYAYLPRLAAPILAIVTFVKYVTSPGLNDVARLSKLDLRDGGHFR